MSTRLFVTGLIRSYKLGICWPVSEQSFTEEAEGALLGNWNFPFIATNFCKPPKRVVDNGVNHPQFSVNSVGGGHIG